MQARPPAAAETDRERVLPRLRPQRTEGAGLDVGHGSPRQTRPRKPTGAGIVRSIFFFFFVRCPLLMERLLGPADSDGAGARDGSHGRVASAV
eukprot:1618117-Rhodomonas_salina.3